MIFVTSAAPFSEQREGYRYPWHRHLSWVSVWRENVVQEALREQKEKAADPGPPRIRRFLIACVDAPPFERYLRPWQK